MSSTLGAPQLIDQLKQNPSALHNLYVIHGDEALQQQEAQDAIRHTAREQAYLDRHVFTVAGARYDWSPILGAASSMGLFAEKQIIEIRIPTGKPGKEGSNHLQRIAELAAQDSERNTLYLIALPSLDKSARNSAWFKALSQQAVNVAVKDIPPNALPRWIAQRLNAQGHTFSQGQEGQQALQYFAQSVEGNLLSAQQAIEKLALTNPPGELTLNDIVSSTSDMARFDVFSLSESLLSGQVGRCQRMFHSLEAAGDAPVMAHWVVSEDIRNLYRIRSALDSGQPLPAAMQSVRAWGNKQRLYERAVQQLSATYLRHMLSAAHIVDGVIKGIAHTDWPKNNWQALSRLGLTLAQKLATR